MTATVHRINNPTEAVNIRSNRATVPPLPRPHRRHLPPSSDGSSKNSTRRSASKAGKIPSTTKPSSGSEMMICRSKQASSHKEINRALSHIQSTHTQLYTLPQSDAFRSVMLWQKLRFFFRNSYCKYMYLPVLCKASACMYYISCKFLTFIILYIIPTATCIQLVEANLHHFWRHVKRKKQAKSSTSKWRRIKQASYSTEKKRTNAYRRID